MPNKYGRSYGMASTHNLTSVRDVYCARLAWRWVRRHRPDLEEIIRAESLKKYPLPKGAKLKVHDPLPEILETTK